MSTPGNAPVGIVASSVRGVRTSGHALSRHADSRAAGGRRQHTSTTSSIPNKGADARLRPQAGPGVRPSAYLTPARTLAGVRYAITGATGFVGGAIAGQLRDAGHEVRALVRSPSKATALSDNGVQLISGDLDDVASLTALCDGVDGLFHVAGWYKLGSRKPEDGFRVNVEGTRAVLAAARRADVSRTVYTSTLAVNSDTHGRVVDESYRFFGRHLSTYDQTKALAHRMADTAISEGQDVVVVQPGLVYGPGDTSQTGGLIAATVAGKRPLVPDAGGVCWGYINDIAAGHMLAMDRGVTGESYFLAGPVATLAAGLKLAARLAGVKGPRIVPTPAIRAMAGAARALGFLPLPADYAAESLRAATASYLGDSVKAQHDLGWSARGMRDGLELTVRALRARSAA